MNYDCQSCGACCSIQQAKGPTPWWAQPELDIQICADGTLTRFVCGRCDKFSGKVGMKTSCKVYDKRPKICVEFVEGSEDCLRARKASGIV